jgi:hypothetical protein
VTLLDQLTDASSQRAVERMRFRRSYDSPSVSSGNKLPDARSVNLHRGPLPAAANVLGSRQFILLIGCSGKVPASW